MSDDTYWRLDWYHHDGTLAIKDTDEVDGDDHEEDEIDEEDEVDEEYEVDEEGVFRQLVSLELTTSSSNLQLYR